VSEFGSGLPGAVLTREEIPMLGLPLPSTILSRRLTLALLAAALLPRPAAVRADHDGT
jgi:hypothetical protein